MAEAVREARAVYGDEWVVRVLVDASVEPSARAHIQAVKQQQSSSKAVVKQ